MFGVLADVANIPVWAPAFADAVVPIGGGVDEYEVTKAGTTFGLRFVTRADSRTIGFLRPIFPGFDGGASIKDEFDRINRKQTRCRARSRRAESGVDNRRTRSDRKSMDTETLFAGIAMSEFETAQHWYERFFDRPADVVAHATEVMWKPTASGWMYIVRDLDHAGHSIVAIAVPDVEQTVAALLERGIESGPIERQSENSRKAVVVDPDGNSIGIIEGH